MIVTILMVRVSATSKVPKCIKPPSSEHWRIIRDKSELHTVLQLNGRIYRDLQLTDQQSPIQLTTGPQKFEVHFILVQTRFHGGLFNICNFFK